VSISSKSEQTLTIESHPCTSENRGETSIINFINFSHQEGRNQWKLADTNSHVKSQFDIRDFGVEVLVRTAEWEGNHNTKPKRTPATEKPTSCAGILGSSDTVSGSDFCACMIGICIHGMRVTEHWL
jgi:hypothetical protein